MEADLQRYYGIDLGDLWRGRLSLRRLAVLVAQLPNDSATAAALADLPRGWTIAETLLADVFHALTGEPHPARPNPSAKAKAAHNAEKIAKLIAQRERLERIRAEQAKHAHTST